MRSGKKRRKKREGRRWEGKEKEREGVVALVTLQVN